MCVGWVFTSVDSKLWVHLAETKTRPTKRKKQTKKRNPAMRPDAFWPQDCDNALGDRAGRGKHRCRTPVELKRFSAKHNYSVLHFSRQSFRHLCEAAFAKGSHETPLHYLPEPTIAHFMKSDGDPLWPSQGPAGVKPIRRGYKMLLLFFLSVIKAVNWWKQRRGWLFGGGAGWGQRHAGAVLEETLTLFRCLVKRVLDPCVRLTCSGWSHVIKPGH